MMKLRHAARSALFAACAAFALAAPAAFAAPPSDAQVDQLMELTQVRKTLDGMWPQLEAMQRQMVDQTIAGKGETISAEDRAEIDALMARQMASMREAMSWEKLAPIYRDIYQKTFEDEDVAAMITFYQSEAGQKLVAKTPQLMQNTMQATQSLIAPMIEDMQRDIAATAADATAEGTR